MLLTNKLSCAGYVHVLQVLESTKDTTKDNEPMCFEIGAGEIVSNPLFQVGHQQSSPWST